jgi:hypothetical protein
MSNISTQQTFSESDVREIIRERDKEWFQIIESILNFHPISMTEALKIGIARTKTKNQLIRQLNERIKRLEDAGDALCENSNPSRWDSPAAAARKLTEQSNWLKAKEAKP